MREPAAKQETILSVFEEVGWQPHIDDPLSRQAGISSQKRLHDSVRRLNDQLQPLIRFECDGTGEGILWSWREAKNENAP